MTSLATLVGYVVVEHRHGKAWIASNLLTDHDAAREQLDEHRRVEDECNGSSTYAIHEVHDTEDTP